MHQRFCTYSSYDTSGAVASRDPIFEMVGAYITTLVLIRQILEYPSDLVRQRARQSSSKTHINELLVFIITLAGIFNLFQVNNKNHQFFQREIIDIWSGKTARYHHLIRTKADQYDWFNNLKYDPAEALRWFSASLNTYLTFSPITSTN